MRYSNQPRPLRFQAAIICSKVSACSTAAWVFGVSTASSAAAVGHQDAAVLVGMACATQVFVLTHMR